jgi:NADP-dependent aldehyde dehydrogenase
MAAVAAALDGNLTGCVYSDTTGKDDADYARLAPVLRGKVGRLLNDKMPTGVAVSPAMNHGGPYPATGHPASRPSASGVAAALRGAALLRRGPPAPPAARAREQEPDGQDVAADRRHWSQGDVAE